MRLLFLPLLLSSWAAASTGTVAGKPISLEEAYKLSLTRSEQLAIQGQGVAELEARISELYSNVRPRVSVIGSHLWQDEPDGGGGFATNFAQRTRPEARVNARQPLFSGFREFLAVRSAKRSVEAGELDLLAAKQKLYQDVADAYLRLLGVHQELETRRRVVEHTSDRAEDLRQRERIGRSRKSELLAAESQLAQTVADLETAKGDEREAQWALRFLTGSEEDLAPADVALPAAPAIQDYLSRARARPDVEARRKEAEALRLATRSEGRQRWPTIAAEGNYYLKRPTGFTETIKWDALVSASLPLYAGGQISADVAQARARERAAEQKLALALRTAELEARTRHEALTADLSRVAALEKAARAAEANARAQAADYRNGLVTNLDVLTSLNVEQEARLRYVRARLDAYLSLARLEVAAGGPR